MERSVSGTQLVMIVVCVDYEEQPVRLRLTDVNDEVPQFQNAPRPFLAMVSSDAPLGTSVYQLMANDHDHDSLVRYSLESGKHRPNCFCFILQYHAGVYYHCTVFSYAYFQSVTSP